MSPRVTAVRVQNQWLARTPRLRCVARLTRSLTRDELERFRAYSEFTAADDLVIYTCRPEEVEEWEKQLAVALEDVSGESDHRRAKLAAERRIARVSLLRPVR